MRWRGWESLGGVISSVPHAVSWGSNRLDIFALGLDTALWHKAWNGSTWSAWQPMGGLWTASPAAACRPGSSTVDLFERGTDNAIWTTSATGT